jgi:hypothetical protein
VNGQRARQPATAPLDVDGAGRGEHSGVALIGIGEDVPSACLGQVAREHIAAGSDRRAPTGAPVDHGDGFHRLDHFADRCLPPPECRGNGQPVEA